MTLYKTGWTVIVLEIILLLIWLYDIYFSKNGTDAAGRGMGMIYILALTTYIIIGLILMLVNNKYCTIVVLVMAAIPLLLVIYGLARQYL